jgi:hypothetical protein
MLNTVVWDIVLPMETTMVASPSQIAFSANTAERK